MHVCEYMQSIKPPSGNRVWRLAVCLVDIAVVRTRRINYTITAFTLSRIRLTDVVGRCSFTSSPLIKSSLNANTLTHWLIWWQRCKKPRTPGRRGHHRIYMQFSRLRPVCHPFISSLANWQNTFRHSGGFFFAIHFHCYHFFWQQQQKTTHSDTPRGSNSTTID